MEVQFDHEGFLDNIPQPLYKYRVWKEPDKEKQYQRRLLTDRELYLSSAAQFNDPFDAALPYKYKDEDLTPENIFMKLRETGKRRFPGISEEELQERAFKEQMSGRFENGQYWKENFERFREDNAKNFGILCLTSKRDNLLMWSHYADSHRGFCVGFDKYVLYELTGGTLGKVQYEKAFPTAGMFDDDAGSLIRLLITKSEDWFYEDEYRIVKVEAARTIKILPESAITEVVLGLNMPENIKDTVIKHTRENFPAARLYQSVMSLNEFKVDIIPILL